MVKKRRKAEFGKTTPTLKKKKMRIAWGQKLSTVLLIIVTDFVNFTLCGYYTAKERLQPLKILKNQINCASTFVGCVSIHHSQFLSRLQPSSIHCLAPALKEFSLLPFLYQMTVNEKPTRSATAALEIFL